MAHHPIISAEESFADIPALFEPGAPPAIRPPPPIAQTEVGRTQTPNKLLVQEEIGTRLSLKKQSGTRFAPYVKDSPTQVGQRVTPRCSETPVPKAGTSAGKLCHTTPSDSDSSSSPSGTTDDSDDENLIPKPEGEAGRPGRGGYNFEVALGWKKKEFQKLKVLILSSLAYRFVIYLSDQKFVKELIDEHLDISKKPTSQSQASVNTVHKLVRHLSKLVFHSL